MVVARFGGAHLQKNRIISLLRQGERGDFFGIVRDGFLKVVKEDDKGRRIVLGYMRRGEAFGEVALLEDQPRTASVLTGGKAEIIRIHREDFQLLCERFPQVAERLRASRRNREEQSTPDLAKRLERSSKGYIQADALLVMDLELCVKCDLCVEACESLHGVSRLTRRGTQVGKYLAPTACRHCEDPVCIHSCPTGAIKRRPEGEIFIDYKTCTGVGACTLACPYGNIQMVDSLIFDQAQARKQRLHPDQDYFRPFPENIEKREVGLLQRLLGIGSAVENEPVVDSSSSDGHKVPPTLPVKCDLCDGLPFMGCVHACPTGAAIRIDPRTLFEGEGVVESGSVIAKAGRGESK